MHRHLLTLCSLIALAWSVWPLPAYAQASIPEACVDVLATEENRWDGIPMDVFVWDGAVISLGEIDVDPISLCRASGPLEILPPSQLIGCVLVGVTPARVAMISHAGPIGRFACWTMAALLWIARSSAASNEVMVFPWDGRAFLSVDPHTRACWDDPLTPVADAIDCGR